MKAIKALLISWVIFFIFAVPSFPQSDPYFLKRKEMVERDIMGRGIKDKKVLDAMMKVERHLFVEEGQRKKAYNDHPLPIGEGQTISQPYIVALMTEAVSLKGGEKVLEIGTGSGYQAAVLAEIVKEVYTVEINKKLYETATERLKRLGYRNVFTKLGDGYQGWEEHAPFDVIMITAAADHIPKPLISQLKEGGRLIMPLGLPRLYQSLYLVTKEKGKIIKKDLGGVIFVPMTGEAQK
ncbi:MAG: protein-L-isoaspartate(D-aspartate) O-methyltransferase [Syntrophorhabdaceae bacterium]|nr:protein-L-isoaspartate(D-aspartate) O-methyltransferase [Syntrophorhabdaceae bacterium]